jgi:hypothetical protein
MDDRGTAPAVRYISKDADRGPVYCGTLISGGTVIPVQAGIHCLNLDCDRRGNGGDCEFFDVTDHSSTDSWRCSAHVKSLPLVCHWLCQ